MIVAPHIAHGPSPRTQALAERLRSEIAAARLRDAKLTDDEVRAALSLVSSSMTTSTNREAVVGISIALGVLGLILGVGLASKSAMTTSSIVPIALAGVVVLLAVVAVVVVLRNRD